MIDFHGEVSVKSHPLTVSILLVILSPYSFTPVAVGLSKKIRS